MESEEKYPRRPNRLRLRGFDYAAKGTYFLTICTRNKRLVFSDKRIRRIVFDTARIIEKQIGVHIIAMSVMTDHVHLIIHNAGGNAATLGDFVRSYKSRIYRECRKEFGLKKSFWQRYYYDHIVRDQRDFEEKFQYVVNNPIKAGLTQRECDPEYVYVNLDIMAGRREADPYAAG